MTTDLHQAGMLQVKVTSDEGKMPVQTANVRVRDALGGIVYALTTDIYGMTEEVKLFAPSKEFSMHPFTSHLAYSTYEILVTHSGFVPQMVRGVRVFEGVRGTLPVDLVPRTPGTDLGDSVNVVELPPPAASPNFVPTGMWKNRYV